MATHRIGIIGPSALPDDGRFFGPISGQLTLANPDVGKGLCLVLAEDAADSGLNSGFEVPQNYAGSPKIVVKGILDGAPGAADILAFTYQHLALADNEAADAAFQTADLSSSTIGSNGGGYSDEDAIEKSLTLSNNTLAAGEFVRFKFNIDISVNTFAGNFLITELLFEYSDA